jgi:hypothetical protein
MRRIHQLFVEADQGPIRRATADTGREGLCWYPSAGTDFRHIRMLEDEGLNAPDAVPPLIYLHTDIRLPEKSDETKEPMTSPFFVSGNIIGDGMFISGVTEIHPKKVTREVSRWVCFSGSDENTGRAFLLDVTIITRFRERLIRFNVPVLYVIAENLAFLAHVLLHHQLQIDTLVHIRDGGGTMGGSKIPMNFIYQAAPLLNLKRVVCDEPPKAKTFDTRTDFTVLMQEVERCERHGSPNLSRIFQEPIQEISELDIRTAWEGKRIRSQQMRRDPRHYRGRGNGEFYYDWRSRINAKSEQDSGPNS